MVLETAAQFRTLSPSDQFKLDLARATAKQLAEADVLTLKAAKARIARGAGTLADFQTVQADLERRLDDDADSRAGL